MVNQRKKAEHAAYEMDNGSSSPTTPEVWDDEEPTEAQWAEMERHYLQDRSAQPAQPAASSSAFQTPPRPNYRQSASYPQVPSPIRQTNTQAHTDEELWAMEAARAEEAEREAEEAEMARLMEEAYDPPPNRTTSPQDEFGGMDIDMDMDWEMESD